jgi:hypothetical protein
LPAAPKAAGTLESGVTTKDIRTSTQDTVCDVCGRTLLRGEHADSYLDGASARTVCELCKDRALHEGWVRAGTVTAYGDGGAPVDRRRSLLHRLRGGGRREPTPEAPSLRDELDGHAWSQETAQPAEVDELRFGPSRPRRPAGGSRAGRQNRQNGSRRAAGDGSSAPVPEFRESRHVRAVPTSDEQKIVSAAALFNESDHTKTVAGVARSLGAPAVCVAPSAGTASGVLIIVAWELCWYRYEVDLSDEVPSVRGAGQGYELSELSAEELAPNAAADELGRVLLPG